MSNHDVERHVLQHIDTGELVDFAKSLIRIPSFIGEETPIARWLASYLAARGYEVELQEVEPGWFQTVAVLKGSGRGRSLMFNGHLDINPWPPAGHATLSTPGSRATSSTGRGAAT